MSILLGSVFIYTWYSQLYLMYFFLQNNVSTYTTEVNFANIGLISLKTMKAVPFYGFYYNNAKIMRTDKELCQEFDGDCGKFVDKYFKIKWING